eukprot:TRINITY_DN18318_c0_g1_i1.p1 TRINITY_DN18318_c0_g1~~TRINITY_DN18318_c0_g1_i1.p1  ORF type:complete len:1126 (+),score=379.31 TRINITY_DN18318_c0_g1_i1:129-3506(+)
MGCCQSNQAPPPRAGGGGQKPTAAPRREQRHNSGGGAADAGAREQQQRRAVAPAARPRRGSQHSAGATPTGMALPAGPPGESKVQAPPGVVRAAPPTAPAKTAPTQRPPLPPQAQPPPQTPPMAAGGAGGAQSDLLETAEREGPRRGGGEDTAAPPPVLEAEGTQEGASRGGTTMHQISPPTGSAVSPGQTPSRVLMSDGAPESPFTPGMVGSPGRASVNPFQRVTRGSGGFQIQALAPPLERAATWGQVDITSLTLEEGGRILKQARNNSALNKRILAMERDRQEGAPTPSRLHLQDIPMAGDMAQAPSSEGSDEPTINYRSLMGRASVGVAPAPGLGDHNVSDDDGRSPPPPAPRPTARANLLFGIAIHGGEIGSGIPAVKLCKAFASDPELFTSTGWPGTPSTLIKFLVAGSGGVQDGTAVSQESIQKYCQCRWLFDHIDVARKGEFNAWDLATALRDVPDVARELGIPPYLATSLFRQISHGRPYCSLADWYEYFHDKDICIVSEPITSCDDVVRRVVPHDEGDYVSADAIAERMKGDRYLQMELGWSEPAAALAPIGKHPKRAVAAELIKLRWAWSRIDSAHDGFIGACELGDALEEQDLCECLGRSVSDVQVLWKELDSSGTGVAMWWDFYQYFAEEARRNSEHRERSRRRVERLRKAAVVQTAAAAALLMAAVGLPEGLKSPRRAPPPSPRDAGARRAGVEAKRERPRQGDTTPRTPRAVHRDPMDHHPRDDRPRRDLADPRRERERERRRERGSSAARRPPEPLKPVPFDDDRRTASPDVIKQKADGLRHAIFHPRDSWGSPIRPAGRTPSFPTTPADRYVKIKKLGEGNFGIVYLVQRRSDGLMLVTKEPKRPVGSMTAQKRAVDAKRMRKVQKEAAHLMRLKHPNILRFIEAYWTDGALVIVTEYCDGGDLAAWLTRYRTTSPIAAKWSIFEQIAEALRYMHERNILHRDLKPANILLTSRGVVKLADFGLAKALQPEEQMAHTICGTELYMAPEVHSRQPYGRAADVFALGCILYQMVKGRKPYVNLMELQECKPPADVPRYASTLCRSMLSADPAARPGIAQVLRRCPEYKPRRKQVKTLLLLWMRKNRHSKAWPHHSQSALRVLSFLLLIPY